MKDIIYEDLKAKAELLNSSKQDLLDELNSIDITTFLYNKRIKEITKELEDIEKNLTKANKNLFSYIKKNNIVED
jgi:predicted  nucleic acid-binding Zn-ribbon protein